MIPGSTRTHAYGATNRHKPFKAWLRLYPYAMPYGALGTEPFKAWIWLYPYAMPYGAAISPRDAAKPQPSHSARATRPRRAYVQLKCLLEQQW